MGAARRAGVDEAALTDLGNYQPTTGFPSDLDSVVRFTQQLLRANRVDDEVFQTLLQAHDARWLVELHRLDRSLCRARRHSPDGFEVNPVDPTVRLPEAKAPAGLGIGTKRPPSQQRVPLVTSRDQVAEKHRMMFDLLEVTARPGPSARHSAAQPGAWQANFGCGRVAQH